MPSPSTAKQLLSLPFRTGLSQKQDPRWLAPGALLTAENAVHPKSNVVGKRAGYTALSTTFIPPNLLTNSFGPTSILEGKRLGNDGRGLLAIGKDTWTDAAFTYDEQGEQWTFVDRVPEAYVLPDRTIASYDDTIREMDTAVCNGYAVHVWLVSANSTNNTGQVYFKVENAQTGATVVAPQRADPTLGNGQEQVAAKIVTCGTNVVLGFVTGTLAGGFQLNLYILDGTQPWKGFVGPTAIPNLTGPAIIPFTNRYPQLGAWDIGVEDSSTFQVVYQQAGAIQLSTCGTTSPPTVLFSASLNGGDPGYVADGEQPITAFGLDINGVLSTVTYAYRATGAPLRVKVQQWNTNTFTTSGTAVDLMGTPGPVAGLLTLTSCPFTIAIAPIRNGYLKVAWSPYNSEWAAVHPDGTGGGATAFAASWIVIPVAGAMQVATAQPRVTMGICLASRWLPNVNGIGYILGRLPSWEQGTYFLFADDAWEDVISANSGGGPISSWFPMRHVATFAPRLSSWIFANAETTAGATQAHLPALQDQYQPHALPHIELNPGAAGTTVYQSLIGVSSTVQTQNPTLVQFDMDSTLSYQNAVLGENTGIATGCPSLTDGSRVHEFAFPYFPSILAYGLSSGGGILPGLYSYIAIYDWVDARGQLHRSARSGAQAVPVGAGNGTVSVTVTFMGFSAKEKALLASSTTLSPQSKGSLGSQVTVRLFRTQANGEIYYEVNSAPNLQGQQSWTFQDKLSDNTIATNTLLYGDGLNAEMQGAILDNLCPPAFQCMCVHKNRFFGVDGNNIWASKELTSGEGAGFNELSAFSWDGTGNVTAIASLGDNLVLFRSDALAYVTGQGPQDDGGQNDWSPPIEIATDTGAVDWRSVVVKADGVYFDSPAGRRMMGFDLVVTPVPDVEDLLDANPVTTSAVIHPSAGRILTTSNTDDVSVPRQGVIVVRDYVLDSWMTAVQASGNGAVSAVVADAPRAGAMAPTYHWMDAKGVVWRETPSAYFDAGSTYVPMQVETAWVKASGIAGFARFRRLQLVWQNLDAHQLSVYVAYDYSPTYYLMGTVTAAMMSAMASPLCQQLFALPRQRAESVRFKMVDAADAGASPATGQGPLLISADLEVTVYTNSRTNRLPPAQRS